MIKVLLVDDASFVREAIKNILDNISEIEVIGECSDGNQVIPFLEQHAIDVILMDYQMPKLNGIDTTKLVSNLFPEIKIIGVSFNNEQFIRDAFLANGASLFLSKDAIEPNILISKIINCYSTAH